jgi:hypothetical protein
MLALTFRPAPQPQAPRRIGCRVETGGHFIGPLPEQQLRAQTRGGGCRLDAEAALPGKPEEARHIGIEAIDRRAVGGKAAQACPAPLDRLYLPVDHPAHPVDGEGHVVFLGRGIAGHVGRLVVGREPEPVARRLEIELPGQIERQRQGGGNRPIEAQLDNRAAQRRNAQPPRPRQTRHRIGPGPGGIGHQRGAHAHVLPRRAPADLPQAACLFDPANLRAHPQHAARLPRTSQIVLVQPGHVDIGAARLPDRRRPFGQQAGNQRGHGRTVDQFDMRAQPRIVGHEAFQPVAFMGAANHQRAAFVQEAVFGQIGPGSQRERHDRRPAIDLVPEGGGTPRGVIAGVSSASISSTRAWGHIRRQGWRPPCLRR